MSQFVHLHVHSEYSLQDGTVRVKPLVEAVAKQGMPAVALTDHSNLFALVKFYRAARAAGVKPIVGADLGLMQSDKDAAERLLVLCESDAGYRALSRLISRAYLEGQHDGKPLIDEAWLREDNQGLLIILGRHSPMGRRLMAGDEERARAMLATDLERYGDRLHVELVRTGRADEEAFIQAVTPLCAELGIPVLASNDVRFLASDEFEAHEARVCIHQSRVLDDPRRPRDYSAQQYFRSSDEMVELFADVPSALANTLAVAERCNLSLTLGEYSLPDFPIPDGATIDSHLRDEAQAGLSWRLQRFGLAEGFTEADYQSRLEHELRIILQMGFPGYFLIVADFIEWAKDNQIPVGPGRGSGAGSLVAYCLKITDLDPLRYDLLFERFLNPERVSMPDFDVDFCMEKRDRVIDYVARKYGREKVCQIITYGSMAAKAVVRDTGRVLGFPYPVVDGIAKLIPNELGITLEKALETSEELKAAYDHDDEARTVLDMALRLEGVKRNAGKHAGGVVIAPTALTDFCPLFAESGGGGVVTQFDKDDVESVGLVKFDFLGLKTLTIIDWAVASANRLRAGQGEEALDISAIPMDDPATLNLLRSGKTTAVFQLESSGMKEWIVRLQPESFEDIISLLALYRPGPLESGMVGDFVDRKQGKQKIRYPHPDLEPVLSPTYGVILYQEQVMQIAQVLANYSLGAADLLRRAMGKKKPEEMAKQREIFLAGATERGLDKQLADSIFDLMATFAGYGFNKSHSAAYALVSWQTAWLKAHYPAAFMAAVLSADLDNTDKVVGFIDEARAMGLEIAPPHVNQSEYLFAALDERTVVYGIGALKGVGQGAVEAIVEERRGNGEFRDLIDFCQRIDLQKVNKRVLEALIRAGALDGLAENRGTLMSNLEGALRTAEQYGRDQASGQVDLFSMGGAEPVRFAPTPAEDWSEEERLKAERAVLGLYLTGHPFDSVADMLAPIVTARLRDIGDDHVEPPAPEGEKRRGRRREKRFVAAGLIISQRRKLGERPFAVATLDDGGGRIEATLFGETYAEFVDRLEADTVVVVEGGLSADAYTGGFSLRAQRVMTIEEAKAAYARAVLLRVQSPRLNVAGLSECLSAYPGDCGVRLRVTSARASCLVDLQTRVRPCDELLCYLVDIDGVEQADVAFSLPEEWQT
jgi:DNA polymerase-3 subunit alpha